MCATMLDMKISVAPVKALAKEKYGSIKAFSEAAGVHYATAYRYWNDDVSQIDVETLAKIAAALGVEPGKLIESA